jgi:hypothetical protein
VIFAADQNFCHGFARMTRIRIFRHGFARMTRICRLVTDLAQYRPRERAVFCRGSARMTRICKLVTDLVSTTCGSGWSAPTRPLTRTVLTRTSALLIRVIRANPWQKNLIRDIRANPRQKKSLEILTKITDKKQQKIRHFYFQPYTSDSLLISIRVNTPHDGNDASLLALS